MKQMNYAQEFKSPIGPLYLIASETHLIGLVFKPTWLELKKTQAFDLKTPSAILKEALKQLDEYFSGKRKKFDLPLAFDASPFQEKVWKALRKIPYGKTWSYEDQAIAIDNPKAVRAVGLCNGRNPIAIIVPCHRVIGKSGKLTGYAGGIDKKKFLLKLEGVEV